MANRFIIEVRTKGFPGAERDLGKVKKKTDQYRKSNDQLRGSTTGLRRTVGKWRNDLLLVGFSIGAVIASIKKFVDAAAGFEAVKTRLVGLTGSVKNAEKAFKVFNDVAATTPFTLQDVVEAGAQLTAFGVEAEEMIKPVTDLAAFMGTTATEAANSLGRAFAGGAGAADILRERGILNLIKTTQGLDDLSKTTLPQFREALISTLQDPTAGIAGSTDRMSETFVGGMSNMQDSLTRLSAAIGEHLLPSIKQVAEGFGVMADFLEDKLKKAAESQKTAFDELGEAMDLNNLKSKAYENQLYLADFRLRHGLITIKEWIIATHQAQMMVDHYADTIQKLTDKFIEQELPMEEVTIRAVEMSQVFVDIGNNLKKVEKDVSSLANPFRQTIKMGGVLSKALVTAFDPSVTGGDRMKGFIIQFISLLQQVVLSSKSVSEALSLTFTGPLGIGAAIAALAALELAKSHVSSLDFNAAETGFDGIVTEPTLFMTGEGGKAERVSVTPLQGPNINGPQGSGITINISAPLVDDTVIDHIIPAIQKAQRLNLA